MASIKISGLEETTTASGTSVFAVQGDVGHTKKITLANLVTAIKRIMGVYWRFYGSYNALGYIGCTKSSTLQEIVDAIPQWSEFTTWINQEYTVWNEILTALGLSDTYGYLVITRYDSTWEVKFVVFNSNKTYMCRYSETNDFGWTSWEKK